MHDVRSLLGLCSYYRRYVRSFAAGKEGIDSSRSEHSRCVRISKSIDLESIAVSQVADTNRYFDSIADAKPVTCRVVRANVKCGNRISVTIGYVNLQ